MYQTLETIHEDDDAFKDKDLDFLDVCVHTSYLLLLLVFLGSLLLIVFAWFNNYTLNEDFFY